jgi:hypothetical protein
MSFWGRLFGTDAAIEKTIDTVSNGLDKLYYSDEEKADDARKDRSEARRMIVDWMSATNGQNLARRVLALSITFVWLSMYVAGAIGSIVSVWVDNPDNWIKSSDMIFGYAKDLNAAVMLILSFYFCAPYMGNAVDRFINRKKETTPN